MEMEYNQPAHPMHIAGYPTGIIKIFFTMLFVGWVCTLNIVRAQGMTPSGNSPLRMRGYVKEMPAIRFDKDFSEVSFSNLVHNRLNFRLDLPGSLHLAAEGRNRLFYNDMFSDIPGLKDFFGHDDGLVDMSWVWLADGGWLGHSMIDRLYLNWRGGNWQVRMGRQRINWGINLVSNPNDLFNNYSFFDFDYEERPGSDALRIQHYLGGLSRVELAVSPGKNREDLVAAALFGHNLHGFDIQVLSGWFRERIALGGGWAGHIGGAGFKGEFTWFRDAEEIPGVEKSNLVGAVGLDYMFGGGTFGVLEFLYNGGHGRTGEPVLLITQPLRADDIMFSKYAATLSLIHPFSPVFQGGLALMALPDIDAAFLMPNFSYSVMPNLDLEVIAQVFAGGKSSIFEEAGSALYTSLKFSF
jgi:hypothetical protein